MQSLRSKKHSPKTKINVSAPCSGAQDKTRLDIHTFFYRKGVYKERGARLLKKSRNSLLDFWEVEKFVGVYVVEIPIICMKNVMYVLLAVLRQSNLFGRPIY